MLCCDLISDSFADGVTDAGFTVFKAAVDCFVLCMPSLDRRLMVAEAIAAKLNLPASQVRHDIYNWRFIY